MYEIKQQPVDSVELLASCAHCFAIPFFHRPASVAGEMSCHPGFWPGRTLRSLAGLLVLALVRLNAQQSGVSTLDLRKLLKNPVAQKVSLSYANEFGFGSESGTSYLGTFQPVVPFTAGPITFISRPAFTFSRVPWRHQAELSAD